MGTEYEKFASLTNKVMSISKEELNRRLAEYKELSLASPNRRGPKRKVITPSVDRDPAVS
jgi:hypothetical protein